MNPIKQLASQTVIYGISNVFGRMLNYLLTPLYLRLFAPEAFGDISLLYAYATFVMVLLSYGMETAFFRFANKEAPQKVFASAGLGLLVTSSIFGLGVHLNAANIANMLGMQGNAPIIQFLGWTLSLDTLNNLIFAYLRQQNKAWVYAIIRVINILASILLNLLLLVWMPKMQWEYPILLQSLPTIGFIFVANFASSALTTILLLPQSPSLAHAQNKLFLQMLRYGFPLIGVGLAGMVNETLDRILLERLLPLPPSETKAQIGVYAAAYKIAMLMTIFIQTFRMAAEPFFFSKEANNQAKAIYAQVMNYFVLVSCFILWFVLILDKLIISLFFGQMQDAYIAGLGVVPVLLTANLFLGIYYNLSVWYKLADQTKKGAIISFIGAGITIVGLYILIPIYGYWGAAWVTLICYFSMLWISYGWGNRVYPIPYRLKPLAFWIFFTLLMWYGQKQLLYALIVTDKYWLYGIKAFFTAIWLLGMYFTQKRWKML